MVIQPTGQIRICAKCGVGSNPNYAQCQACGYVPGAVYPPPSNPMPPLQPVQPNNLNPDAEIRPTCDHICDRSAFQCKNCGHYFQKTYSLLFWVVVISGALAIHFLLVWQHERAVNAFLGIP